jgi:hypothetical protein
MLRFEVLKAVHMSIAALRVKVEARCSSEKLVTT